MQTQRIAPAALPGAQPAAPSAQPGVAGFDALLAEPPLHPATSVAAPQQIAADIYAAALVADSADREARRHGRAMLKALAALQLSVLGGATAEARSALEKLAGDSMPAHDPVLRLILREIGVRAAVELARSPRTPNVSVA